MKYLITSLLFLPLLVSCEEVYETAGPNYHVHPSREVEVYRVQPAPRIVTRPDVVIVQPQPQVVVPQAHVEVHRPIAPAPRVEQKVVIEAPNAPAPIQRNPNVHGHP